MEEKNSVDFGLFWIPKYQQYRFRYQRHKGGFIYGRYFYIPRRVSIEFHEGGVVKKAFIILMGLLLVAFVIFLFVILPFSLLISLEQSEFLK